MAEDPSRRRSMPLTFKPRRRRMSPRRAAAYERMAQALVPDDGDRLDLAALVEPSDHVVLDIGFGGGESVIEMARARPDEAVIGVDVHTPGVAAVLEAVEAFGWRHVCVVEGDAVVFLRRLPPDSLAGVRIWFPDPWPKVRQRDKRLVQPAVVAQLVERLRPGGWLHLATDAADYADQMRRVCDGETRLVGGVIDRPYWRPVTRCELRGRV